MASTRHKLCTLEAATTWRQARTGRVVFTNGVFDLLHRGHVEYLEAARAEGDHLVAGINSDQSVRGLGKGPGRPLVGQEDRARVVAGLAAVDCVVIFDELTPLALLAALRPDILVKGGDYTRATVVGADLVESWGGKVLTLPFVAGFSTSSLLERCREST